MKVEMLKAKILREEVSSRSQVYFPDRGRLTQIFDSTIDKASSLRGRTCHLVTSTPKEYLGSWLACHKSGMCFDVDPRITEEFKDKVIQLSDKEIIEVIKEAEKRSYEIINVLSEHS